MVTRRKFTPSWLSANHSTLGAFQPILTLQSRRRRSGEVVAGIAAGRRGAVPGTFVWPLALECWSMSVRLGSSSSYWEIITRGSLRGRMVLASAFLSQFQLV